MGAHVIEIPLPEDARLTPFDLDMLKATLASIVSQRCCLTDESSRAVAELEKDGWRISVGPTWLAVARRERSCEHAHGRTPDEAVAKLYDYARHETGFGCP